MQGYRTQLASDIFERDGVGLELYDSSDTMIAEVFRDDESKQIVFSTFGSFSAPYTVLKWFLNQADERL